MQTNRLHPNFKRTAVSTIRLLAVVFFLNLFLIAAGTQPSALAAVKIPKVKSPVKAVPSETPKTTPKIPAAPKSTPKSTSSPSIRVHLNNGSDDNAASSDNAASDNVASDQASPAAAANGDAAKTDDAKPADAKDDKKEEKPNDPKSPLSHWDDPLAKSLQESIGGKSPLEAAGAIAEELGKILQKLSVAVGSLQTTAPGASLKEQIANTSTLQIQVRHLMDAALYYAESIPADQQKQWQAILGSKLRPLLAQTANTMRAKNFVRAAKEFDEFNQLFGKPYLDLNEDIKKLIEEKAPKKAESDSSSGSSSGGTTPYPSGGTTSYPSSSSDSNYGSSYGSQTQGLKAACDQFFAAYDPSKIDEVKMEQVLNQLLPALQANLPGRSPQQGTSGNYGSSSSSYSGYSGETPYASGMPGSSSSSAPGQQKKEGLTFGEAPVEQGQPGRPAREKLDERTQRCLSYALKQMLQKATPKIASKVAAAYCAAATEDFVPEVYSFAAKNGASDNATFYESLAIEKDYANDLRVQVMMLGYLQIAAGDPSKEAAVIKAFSPLKTASPLVTPLLNIPNQRIIAMKILYEIGDGNAALEISKLLADRSQTPEYRSGVIQVLGQIGDEKVVPAVFQLLIDPVLKDRAKEALIRIGSPAETTVLTAFRANKIDIDLVAMEIIEKIGTWKSVGQLASQLVVYAEAKTEEEASKIEGPKPKLLLDMTARNNMMKRTIETASNIMARMLDKKAPNFKGTDTPSTSYSGTTSSSSSSYDSTYYEGSMSNPSSGSSYSGQSSGPSTGPAKPVDPKAPRVLYTTAEVPASTYPLRWAQALAAASAIKNQEIVKFMSKALSYDTGKKAGEEVSELVWIKKYFQTTGAFVKNDCIPLMDDESKKSTEDALAKVANNFKKPDAEQRRIGNMPRTMDGFKEGLKAKPVTPAQTNQPY